MTAVMKAPPTVIVLAAGQGSRFRGGGHKLAAPLRGRAAEAATSRAGGAMPFVDSVLGQTVQQVLESRLPLLLVTTAELAAPAAQVLARREVLLLSREEAGRGMGASIASGVAERAAASGWLLLPGDMPLVRASTLRAVADALELHAVVFAQHKGRRGHPVGFSAELFSELIRLEGDEGAKRVVARYPVHGQEVDDPGVLVDVDTVEDLEALRSRLPPPQRQAAGGGPAGAARELAP
jgi:molybdenum cofactor cytidylyltransferase